MELNKGLKREILKILVTNAIKLFLEDKNQSKLRIEDQNHI